MITTATSCLDSDECSHESYSPPANFVLKLTDGDTINYIHHDYFPPDSIVLYYENDLGKTIIGIYFQQTIDGGYYLISHDLPITMLETGIEEYFLYLSSSDTDTLNVLVKRVDDGCNTWHYYEDCYYNGDIMEFDQVYSFFTAVK